jgi:uncharacterized protein YkwD
MRRVCGACLCARAYIAAGLACTTLAALPAPVAADECVNADSTPGSASPADLSAATVCLVNSERAAAAMKPVAPSAPLTRAAEDYAHTMVAGQFFAHRDPAGHVVADRVAATGQPVDSWAELGENLGWGSLLLATPRAVVNGWMLSPSHRDNILYASYGSLGVGIADGAPAAGVPAALTYVAVFGERRPAARVVKRRRCSRARTRRARACRARLRAQAHRARG